MLRETPLYLRLNPADDEGPWKCMITDVARNPLSGFFFTRALASAPSFSIRSSVRPSSREIAFQPFSSSRPAVRLW